MLIARKMQDLDFAALMEIYAEGNMENGRERYPDRAEFQQIRLAEEDFRDYLIEDFFRAQDAFYAIWTEENKYIAALRMEPYKDGMLLEALETRPNMRNRGYAKRLVSQAMGYLRERGIRYVYSHISRKNKASLKVHEACGFTLFLDHAVYIDGSVSAKAVTVRAKI